jgi:nicotinate-nucleotide adenylyltransferase
MPSRPSLRRFGALTIRTPLALPGQRIGILGGSFNPPHSAHVAISETALRRLRLDRLWWLVTPGNPLKSKSELLPLAERMARCRALVRDRRIKITDFEVALGGVYTAETLAFLVSRYPRAHFVWVMGADNLASFHRWHDWRRIAALMPIAVVDRPHWRFAALASPAARTLAPHRLPEAAAPRLPSHSAPAWAYLATRLSDISSTRIRGRPAALVRAWGVLMHALRERIFPTASG